MTAEQQSRLSALHAFITERSTPDEWRAFSERAEARVTELGGDKASVLEGDAAVQILAFMEAEAEVIAGV